MVQGQSNRLYEVWMRPTCNEVRLDVDVSHKDGVGKCEDVIRNHNTDCMCGFNANIGNYPPPIFGVINIIHGLQLC